MLKQLHPASHRAAPARGLSLVELLVGVAIGLFVVAAAALLVSTQLNDNRRLLAELQVQQDLRASADIITRELRRAGSWGDLLQSTEAVWVSGNAGGFNPDATITLAPGCAANVSPFYSSRTNGQNGPYGFRLQNGAIETLQAAGGWQQLTDRATMEVTQFCVTAAPEPAIQLSCHKMCSDGTNACWPTLRVRRYAITITGRAVADPQVVRTLNTSVRVRNDEITTPGVASTIACPS